MKAPQTPIQNLLAEKLHLKRAQLYRRAKDVADTLSIGTSDGMLVIAAQQKINLHKHGFPAAKVEEIRRLVNQLPATATRAILREGSAGSGNGKPKAARMKKAFRVKLQKSDQGDPLLSAAMLNEMKAMVQIYEILYHLENSIRVFITRVLEAKHGVNWWDTVAPNNLKRQVQNRTQDEAINAWHQKRSANPIDYLDLNQLPALVRAAQADFVPAFFSTAEWFQHFVDEVYRSRCVGCHMNPLTQDNVDAVGVRFNQWQTLVKNKMADLEKLEAAASQAAPPNTVAALPSAN